MLYDLDLSLFRFINQSCSNEWLDVLMPLLRAKFVWLPLYAALLGYILWSESLRKALVIIGCIMLSVTLSDQLSSHVIKPIFRRARPCQTLADINARVNCGNAYSFTSSHAANTSALAAFMCAATFVPSLNTRKRWGWVGWAGMVSVAQIYVGVHYPFDVLGGWLLGTAIGFGVARFLANPLYMKASATI